MANNILQHAADKKIQNYQFSFRAKLGKGAYGTVYAGKNINDNSVVALKVIDKKLLQTDYANQLIASEIEIMKKLDNKNIVKLIDVLQSVNNTYIVTEYCHGGDLREYLKKKKYKQLTEKEALSIFVDMLAGLKCLLNIGIIHRDIKPANILNHEGQFKITDFGFAKQVDSHLEAVMNSLVGTPLYMSPQILKRQKYNSKCDIWSMGLILYEMLYGTTPWHSQNLVELMAKLDSKPLIFPPTVKVSESTKQVIKACLQISEDKRIGWDQLFSQFGISEPMPVVVQTRSTKHSDICENKENKYSIQTQRAKQRTESLCQYPAANKHNRSLSNTAYAQVEDKSPESRDIIHQKNRSYLTIEQQGHLPRFKTELEQERERSNSQLNQLKFNTQRIELQNYLENVHTPPLPNRKYCSTKSTNDSFRTPSAMQSNSTNASNRQHYDQDLKVNDFTHDDDKSRKQSKQSNLERISDAEEESRRLISKTIASARVKRTNSVTGSFLNNTQSPLMVNHRKTHVQQMLKIIQNQQDLIPNHISIKSIIGKLLIGHKQLLTNSTTELLYSSAESKEVKLIMNQIIDYLNNHQGDHFTVQLQVMLLLMINYHKVITENISTRKLQLSESILELIKKNQTIQQNQLHLDPKALRDNINQQLQ